MSDLDQSVVNVRLAAAMEGDHMRSSLLLAMIAETSSMAEDDLVAMVRRAREQLGIQDPAPAEAPASTSSVAHETDRAAKIVATKSTSSTVDRAAAAIRPRRRTGIKLH